MTAGPSLRIGEVAEQLGVTTRTLRYYDELGLVRPAGYSKGGSRRYDERDLQRIVRIRELQAVMGFNLDEIREILHADDRLAELRADYARGGVKKKRAAVAEAVRLNHRTQEQVLAKITLLEAFQHELEATAARYRAAADELGIDVPSDLRSTPSPTRR